MAEHFEMADGETAMRAALEAVEPHKLVEGGSNPPPATISTPSGPPPWEKPKVKRRYFKKRITHISEDVLDNALMLYKGDRKAAAAHLKIPKKSLHFRIEYYPNLKSKWSGDTMAYNSILQNAKQAGMLAEAQINAAYSQTSMVHGKLFKQIESLERQIELGEKARSEPANAEAQKFAFKLSVKGEPLEEKTLRDSLAEMIKLHLETTQSFLGGALIATKIKVLTGGKGGGRGDPTKGAQAGFTGKKAKVIETKP